MAQNSDPEPYDWKKHTWRENLRKSREMGRQAGAQGQAVAEHRSTSFYPPTLDGQIEYYKALVEMERNPPRNRDEDDWSENKRLKRFETAQKVLGLLVKRKIQESLFQLSMNDPNSDLTWLYGNCSIQLSDENLRQHPELIPINLETKQLLAEFQNETKVLLPIGDYAYTYTVSHVKPRGTNLKEKLVGVKTTEQIGDTGFHKNKQYFSVTFPFLKPGWRPTPSFLQVLSTIGVTEVFLRYTDGKEKRFDFEHKELTMEEATWQAKLSEAQG